MRGVKPKEGEGLRVAYLGATLPTLSETFVYQELLAVRREGVVVDVASVFPPRRGIPTEAESLANEAWVVYSARGWWWSLMECLWHPIRSVRTVLGTMRDAACARGESVRTRVRLPAQGIAALGLARWCRVRGVTHLHAHMANTPATLAMLAAGHLSIRFSFTGHANDLFVHGAFLGAKVERAAFVSCISRWHRAFYRALASVSDDRLPIVRCGVEVPGTRGGRVAADSAGDRPALRVLSVGRLVPKKGMGTLIRAAGRFDPRKAGAEVQVDIVGDGPERAVLAEMAAGLGAEAGRVRLLGPRPNREVLELLHSCDVFVLACQRDPSTGDQDGIPVSLMEAMAAGVCVVTCNLDPITELVIDGRTGVCVSPGDADALARAMERLLADPALRERLGQAGREHVAAEFDRTVNARRLAERFRGAREPVGLAGIRERAGSSLTESLPRGAHA